MDKLKADDIKPVYFKPKYLKSNWTVSKAMELVFGGLIRVNTKNKDKTKKWTH